MPKLVVEEFEDMTKASKKFSKEFSSETHSELQETRILTPA